MGMKNKSICLLPKITGVGGPASFQSRFVEEAEKQGIDAHFDTHRKDIGAYLVIGAPKRHLGTMISAQKRKIPVVLRLNGMNWIHRVRPSGIPYLIKAEMANASIAQVRKRLASSIIYQSEFCKFHWDQIYGTLDKPSKIIYNGVDLKRFSPPEQRNTDADAVTIMVTEGNLQRGGEFLLYKAFNLAEEVAVKTGKVVRLQVAGNVAPAVKEKMMRQAAASKRNVILNFLGVLVQKKLVTTESDADMLLSVELNPACPNAVIEAMALGVPVLGYNTGSLKEIVAGGGRIVPYRGNAWKLDEPALEPLVNGALDILQNRELYSKKAREQAETNYSVSKIVRQYLEFCFQGSTK